MSRKTMRHHRRRAFNKRGNRTAISRLRRSRSYPVIKLGATILGILTVLGLFAFVIVPGSLKLLGLSSKPTPSASFIIMPSPTPTRNIAESVGEAVLTSKNAFNPNFYGDEMVFSTGSDTAGSPQMKEIHIFNAATNKETSVSVIQLKNNDLFEPKISEKYIVYIDSKRSGGGNLCVYDRKTNQITQVKEIRSGLPVVRLSGDYLAWTERSGTRQDKLYLYDIVSGQSVTLAVFENSAYGFSAPYISETEIIWVGDSQKDGATKSESAIYSVSLKEGGEAKVFETGMYVHNPMAYGDVRVWSDGNGAEGTSLFVCVKEGNIRKIATDVIQCGIWQDYVAYAQNGGIYMYHIITGETQRVSPENEICSMASFQDGRVVWHDISSDDYERDIIKYVDMR
ncbi:MAG: hypothetical protein ACYCX2_09390 [Christensenellales bacterium]